MYPAFLHSCGFPSPLLWFCPWDLSCLLILATCAQCLGMWPLSCLRELHISQNIWILFPEQEWRVVPLSEVASQEHWWALHTRFVNNHLCVSCVSPLVECPDISVPQRWSAWCTQVVLLEQDSHSRLKQELFRKDFAATITLLSISGVLNIATCQVSFRL